MSTRMPLWVWVLLWAGQTHALTAQGVSVGVDTPECELRNAELHCNYSGVDQVSLDLDKNF